MYTIGGVFSLLIILVLATTPVSSPAVAQEPTAHGITILVPDLPPGEGLRARFGSRVARELRSQIDRLHTHYRVQDRDLRDALRRYNIPRSQLSDCLMARQLAMQEGWDLVVCGSYEDAGDRNLLVHASFVAAESGEAFDVDPFVVSERDTREAASRILETFDVWQTQLRHTLFCSDYVESRQWDLALTNCRQALEINPVSRPARYMLGYIYWQTERLEEALEAVDSLLEVYGLHQDAMKLGGIVATQLGDRPLARAYLDRYMELNPADVRVRLTIATEIANAGDPEGALDFAQQGLEHEPENVDLISYIGQFAMNAALQADSRDGRPATTSPHVAGLYQTAADSFDDVVRLQGDDVEPRVLERLVIARTRLGQVDRAIAVGLRATELAPEDGSVWEAYSRALEEAGRAEQALEAIDRARQLGRAGPALAQRTAQIHLRQRDVAAAVRALRGTVDRGEIDAHDAWRIMFGYAYNDRYRAGQLMEAVQALDLAAPLATAESDRLARNFWTGYFLYNHASEVHQPQTADSARRARPMFERALELLNASRGYERFEPAARSLLQLLEACERMIEIQVALIRRGR